MRPPTSAERIEAELNTCRLRIREEIKVGRVIAVFGWEEHFHTNETQGLEELQLVKFYRDKLPKRLGPEIGFAVGVSVGRKIPEKLMMSYRRQRTTDGLPILHHRPFDTSVVRGLLAEVGASNQNHTKLKAANG